MALEHFLDLGQRLLAQIRGPQQFNFGSLHEVANVVNILSLEAVRAANRQFELIDWAQQDWIELCFGRLRGRLVLALQIDEHRQLVLEYSAGAANRLFGVDGAVGLDIENQLVE